MKTFNIKIPRKWDLQFNIAYPVHLNHSAILEIVNFQPSNICDSYEYSSLWVGRDIFMDYCELAKLLGMTMFGLLSKALEPYPNDLKILIAQKARSFSVINTSMARDRIEFGHHQT